MKIFLLIINLILALNVFAQDDLFKSVKKLDLEKLKQLVNPQNINIPDSFGWTLLMWACEEGDVDIVSYLLDNNAKVDNDLSDNTAFEIATFNDYKDIIKVITSKQVILNNLEVFEDEVSGDKTIRSYLFTKEKPSVGIVNYRVFSKIENGELYYAVGIRLLNKIQKQTNGVVYANKKQFETYVKQYNDTFFKGDTYFNELYTVLFKKEDFEAFAQMDGDISFGIRRGKVDFDFTIPSSCFSAILEKADTELQVPPSD